jgi:metallophosphoesterase superfamily enzyme
MRYIFGFLTCIHLISISAYSLDQDLATEAKRKQFPSYYHQLSDQDIDRLYQTYGPNRYAILGDKKAEFNKDGAVQVKKNGINIL